MLLITSSNLHKIKFRDRVYLPVNKLTVLVHCAVCIIIIITIWYWEVFNLSVFTLNNLAPAHYRHPQCWRVKYYKMIRPAVPQTSGWSWLRSEVLRQTEMWFIIRGGDEAQPVKTRQMSGLLTTGEQMVHQISISVAMWRLGVEKRPRPASNTLTGPPPVKARTQTVLQTNLDPIIF